MESSRASLPSPHPAPYWNTLKHALSEVQTHMSAKPFSMACSTDLCVGWQCLLQLTRNVVLFLWCSVIAVVCLFGSCCCSALSLGVLVRIQAQHSRHSSCGSRSCCVVSDPPSSVHWVKWRRLKCWSVCPHLLHHSGLLSLMVVPFAAVDHHSKCLLHAAFETSVLCQLRLPDLVGNVQSAEHGTRMHCLLTFTEHTAVWSYVCTKIQFVADEDLPCQNVPPPNSPLRELLKINSTSQTHLLP